MNRDKKGKFKPLTPDQINFILENKDKMKGVEIAAILKITPSAVSQRICGRKGITVIREGYFNVDKFAKQYYG